MKILLDAHMLGGRETGNETYTVSAIRALAASETGHELFVACPDGTLLRTGHETSQVHTVPVSDGNLRRLLLDLPRAARAVGADVVHSTYSQPLHTGCATVVSVHDVSFRECPRWFSLRDNLVLRINVGFSARRATRIAALTEHAKTEFCRWYRVSPGQVDVIPPCIPPVEPGPMPANIPRPYCLAVGTTSPRKNITRLLQAFATLKDRPELQLVLTGPDKHADGSLQRVLSRLDLTHRVVHAGYVSEPALAALYAGAELLVYPSLYEGFGLPLLEAMRLGTPVVASDIPPLREAAGDAARFIDPTSTQDLANGVRDVLTDEGLRERLVAAGHRQAGEFTAARMRDRLVDTYTRATEDYRAGRSTA